MNPFKWLTDMFNKQPVTIRDRSSYRIFNYVTPNNPHDPYLAYSDTSLLLQCSDFRDLRRFINREMFSVSLVVV